MEAKTLGLLLLMITLQAMPARADDSAVAGRESGSPLPPLPQHRFVPALSVGGPGSLAALATCPPRRRRRTSLIVTCSLNVTAAGTVDDGSVQCLVPRGRSRRFGEHLQSLLPSARFQPARIDDVAVPVRLYVAALFADDGRSCQVSLMPNAGRLDPEMDLNYVAPQEVLDDGGWRRRVHFVQDGHRHRSGPRGRSMFRLTVHVSDTGVPARGRISNDASLNFDSARAEADLLRSRFIPGFHLGRPRAMDYEERVVLGL